MLSLQANKQAMRHQFLIISVFFLSLLAAGCRDDSKELSRLEEIKTIGDRDPYLALQMLDSVMPLMRWSSDLVQKKCELLEVRLKDKAYIPITSDIIVKDFLPYSTIRATTSTSRRLTIMPAASTAT